MMGTISHWLLIFFLISGGLSAELVMAPSHIEFAAEEDFSAVDRQDESLRSLASRKQSARGRKTKLPYTVFLATAASPSNTLTIPKHPLPCSSLLPSQQQLHQVHEVFRI
jgi:hypothetical protein